MREIFTIGFSKKTLRKFVSLLKSANVTYLVDIRANNTSQLSGFAKKEDLEYIMELVGVKYNHIISLAPNKDLLDAYKKNKMSWHEYEVEYIDGLNEGRINQQIEQIIGEGIPCFLCSEDKPNHCHRGLLAEYIKKHAEEEIKISHLI